MMRRLFIKMKMDVGESIAEVLVALLISSLGLALLAMMVSSSSRMVQSSKTKVHEYLEASKNLETQSKGEIDGETISFSGDTTSQITDGSDTKIAVLYFVNDTFNSEKVISYKKK